MHQTLCADIHFITGGACMYSVCFCWTTARKTYMQAGLYMCPSISADRNEMNLLATTNAVVRRGQN